MAQTIKKIEPYQRLAHYYDRLMDYIDYDVWIDDIETIVGRFGTKEKWLDISCGTGSMAIKLAKRGKQITAVDLSPYMIEIAANKASEEKVEIDFHVGNMINYDDGNRYDVIFNLHDGLNYLLENTDTQSFINNSYKLLNPDGLLLFDVVTPLLCQNHFRGYREIFSDELGGYERYTSYDPATQLAESRFTINTDTQDQVEVESHIQRAYDLDAVESLCSGSAYTWWQILDDETLEEAAHDSERFLVIMRK